MKKARVLFVSQEITPYLPETPMSSIGRHLPQGIHERGKEIRTFMPRYGCINERRHQLHEVIRLSGMNLIINDSDHPLIIKVGSIQPARMQVYFIDNEEYFQRKAALIDSDGNAFEDNDERAIFFCRGVLETVKKLGWSPDLIHCHGWMTSVLPLYLKKYYKDDPIFANSKVVYSPYNSEIDTSLSSELPTKMISDGIPEEDVALIKDDASIVNMNKLGVQFADAIIHGDEALPEDLVNTINEQSKPTLGYQAPEGYIDAYSDFYDSVMEENSILAE